MQNSSEAAIQIENLRHIFRAEVKKRRRRRRRLGWWNHEHGKLHEFFCLVMMLQWNLIYRLRYFAIHRLPVHSCDRLLRLSW